MTGVGMFRDTPPDLPGCVVALGAFDGVHRGHRHLVAQAVGSARAHAVPAVVWTFDPPPKAALAAARPIMRLEEKIQALRALGADLVVVSTFDETFRRLSAAGFLRRMAAIRPLEVHVGSGFRFGARQSGDTDRLAARYPTVVHELVRCGRGEVISSTRIRRLLGEGRTTEAEALRASAARGEARHAKGRFSQCTN